jgi:hypothetical protein
MRSINKKAAFALLVCTALATFSGTAAAGEFCDPTEPADGGPGVPPGGDPDLHGNDCRQQFHSPPPGPSPHAALRIAVTHPMSKDDSGVLQVDICGIDDILKIGAKQPGHYSLIEISFAGIASPSRNFSLLFTAATTDSGASLYAGWYETQSHSVSISDPNSGLATLLDVTPLEVGPLDTSCLGSRSTTPLTIDLSRPMAIGMTMDPDAGWDEMIKVYAPQSADMVPMRIWAGQLATENIDDGTLSLRWVGIHD